MIVETARQLFFDQGYANTGMAQILKVSGANSGSLYHFFPTKEDLLVAVLDKYETMLEPMVVGPAFERVSDPVERVFAILDGYRQLIEMTEFRLGCPIGNLALEMSNDHPKVRTGLVRNFEGWLKVVSDSLKQAEGRFPPDTDLDRLAISALATMEGAVMLARTYRSTAPFDAAVAELREAFERLIQQGTDWNQPRNEL